MAMRRTGGVLRFALTLLLLAVVAFTGLAWGSSESRADEQGPELAGGQIDYLGVAAVMIRDGNYDRARAALDEVDPAEPGVDVERYFTLSGLVALREGEFRDAADAFELAQSAGADDPVIDVYLAQAYYSSEQYRETIEAIGRIRDLNRYADLYSVLAESHWRLGNQVEAYRILSRAIELFPDRSQFLRQRVFYLVDLDLSREAAEQGLAYVEAVEDAPEAYVTVGEALRRGGNTDLAIRTLEMGRLRFPGNERLHLALAQAYLAAGQLRNAGEMVQRAASSNLALYYEAAEIYRRAGEYERALFLNSQVVDERKKAPQRFNILVSMERYEEALSLEQRLIDTGALEDDNLSYAVAYAFYETRQLDRAVAYTNRIESPELFRRATQLRRAIETVRNMQEQQVRRSSETDADSGTGTTADPEADG